MVRITFGKYVPGESFIYFLDGRLKFVAFVLLMSSIFLQNNFLPYFILLVFFFLIFFLARLPLIVLWNVVWPVLFMFFFLFVFNFIQLGGSEHSNSDVIWSWHFFQLRYSGLVYVFYYSLRVFLVIFLTILLVTTTKPKTLTLSIEYLLKPLKKFYFPVHIFSVIISLTLRLVPTFIEEARNILEAQASRGLDFKNSGFRKKIQVLISLLIPLIVSIFKRADDMATAMESRGYVPGKPRSHYQQFTLLYFDWIWFGVVLVVFFFIVFYLNLTPEQNLFSHFPLNEYFHIH